MTWEGLPKKIASARVDAWIREHGGLSGRRGWPRGHCAEVHRRPGKLVAGDIDGRALVTFNIIDTYTAIVYYIKY